MLKALTLFLSLVVVGLGVALAMELRLVSLLRQDLQTSRGLAAEKSTAAVKEQEQVAKLTERNEAYRAESEQLRAKLGGGGPAGKSAAALVPQGSAAAAAVAAEAGAEPAKGNEKPGAGMANALGKMFSDPNMKKMIRQQQAMAVRMMYGDLTKQLNLSPEQNERVMGILSERTADQAEAAMAMMNGDKSKSAEAGKALSDQTAKYNAQIKDALGGQYSDFQAFEKTIGDRTILTQYQQQFASAGQPLSDPQRESLLQIMSEEREKMPVTALSQPGGDMQAKMSALGSDETLHALFADQEELNRRISARAATVLTPEQVTAFNDMQARMLQMQQAGLQMSRTMFNSK